MICRLDECNLFPWEAFSGLVTVVVEGVLYGMFAARLSEISDWLWFCVTSPSSKWTTRLVFSLLRFYDLYWLDRLRSPTDTRETVAGRSSLDYFFEKQSTFFFSELIVGSLKLVCHKKPPSPTWKHGRAYIWDLGTTEIPEVCSIWGMILDWAEKSGIMAPKVSSSNDKPELRFGVPDMEDLSIRRRGVFQWECFAAELKNLGERCQWLLKDAENERRVEPNVFESISRCVQLRQVALPECLSGNCCYVYSWFEHFRCDFEFRLGWTISHKITWSCSKGLCQCRWADWSTASNGCVCSTSNHKLEITLIPFWHRMIQSMAPLQKRPGLKRIYHFDFQMILHFNVGMIPIRLVSKAIFVLGGWWTIMIIP